MARFFAFNIATLVLGLVTGACQPSAKPWSTFKLRESGAAAHPSTTTISVVSRIPDSMEVFWIGPDGSVNDTHWYEGQPWKAFELAPRESASATAGISAVSRRSNTIEVFWIGKDGSVQNAHWYNGSSWQQYTLAPTGSASTAAGIAAISTSPDSIDLFWVSATGALRNANWENSRGAWTIQDIAFGVAANSAIAAVNRAGKAEAFYHRAETKFVNTTCPETKQRTVVVNGQTQIETTLEYVPCVQPYISHFLMAARGGSAGSGWRIEQIGLVGGATPTIGRTDIAAVSRQPDTVEVFYMTSAGAVRDAHWYEGSTEWKGFAFTGDGSASASGGVTAVSRRPETIEVLWVGSDGSIVNRHWYDGSQWEGFELAGPNSAAKDADVTMISRIPASLESFWIAEDGAINDSHWYE